MTEIQFLNYCAQFAISFQELDWESCVNMDKIGGTTDFSGRHRYRDRERFIKQWRRAFGDFFDYDICTPARVLELSFVVSPLSDFITLRRKKIIDKL
jgi:hypothetical protein